MILSVSLDPKMTKVIFLDNLEPGKKHIVKKVKTVAEDGGMDISKIVSEFNEDVFCIGFSGGRNGEEALEYLDDNLVNNEFIPTQNETRAGVSIITEDGRETGISDVSPRVMGQEVEAFYSLYKEFIKSANIVCLSGSVARGLREDIYDDLILLAREENKKIIGSISGEHLRACLNNGPDLLNINLEDLEEITGLIVDTDEDIISLAHNILQNDIKMLAVYKGNGDYVVVDRERAYISKLDDEYIFNQEAGREGFLAGFAVSEERNYDTEYKIRISIACHIAKAVEYEPGIFNMKKMKSIMNELDIEVLNI